MGQKMSNLMLEGAKLNNAKVVNSRRSYSDMTGAHLYNTDLTDTRISEKPLKIQFCVKRSCHLENKMTLDANVNFYNLYC